MNAARKARALVDLAAFDELIAAYGGIVSFAEEIEHDRKTVWAWRTERSTPPARAQREINARAARQKLAAPYPEAVADTRIRTIVRHEVLDEAIEALGVLDGDAIDDAKRILAALKTRPVHS